MTVSHHGARKKGACFFVALLALGLAGVTRAQPAQEPPSEKSAPTKKIDPRAEELLRRMSGFLAGQKSLAAEATSTLEVVEGDKKTEASGRATLKMARPDRLRIDRTGEVTDLGLWFDGKTLTVLEKKTNAFAQVKRPSDIDGMLEYAADRLELYPPGADLLSSRSYDVLTSDVVTGEYKGRTTLDGRPVHHLSFVGNTTDLELWIEDGERPLPRKMVVVSKDLPQAPRYQVTISRWELGTKIDDKDFQFVAPKGAERISFLERKDKPPPAQGRKGANP